MNFTEKFNHACNGGYCKKFIGHVNSKSTLHPYRYIIDTAIDFIPVREYKNILDIGTGDGYGLNFMKNKFKSESACGITLSEQEKNWAKEVYPGVNVKVMDVHDLRYDDNYFDLITARDSFEHFLSPFLALNEIYRVLKQDGLVMIALPVNETWLYWDEHLLVPTFKQMEHLLKLSGFEILKYEETEYEEKVCLTQAKYLAKKI